MRNYNGIFHVQNTISGILRASAAVAHTIHGNSIDTIGFQDMLGILCLGVMKGSAASNTAGADVTVKWQEAVTTTGPFTDITDGALNGTASVYGSAKFDVVSCLGGSSITNTALKQRKLYMLLNQDGRKRYIRAQASITGTTANVLHVNIAVAAILGRARESGYIIDTLSHGLASSDIGSGTTAMGFVFSSTPV